MRTLETHFETVCDWSVVKWSVLIGQLKSWGGGQNQAGKALEGLYGGTEEAL